MFATMTLAGEERSSAEAAATAAVASKGQMLMGADGGRLGVVSRVDAGGGAQIIIDGRLVTVPASTLSRVNGKLTTSLTKSQVLAR